MEKIVTKGKIDHHEHFHFLSKYFRMFFAADAAMMEKMKEPTTFDLIDRKHAAQTTRLLFLKQTKMSHP